MFTRGSLRRSDVNDVIYFAEGADEGLYGCMRGPIWFHVRVNMGSHERAVMCLAPRAVSARVAKHFVTIFSKTCNI